jgi:hypothetical protein
VEPKARDLEGKACYTPPEYVESRSRMNCYLTLVTDHFTQCFGTHISIPEMSLFGAISDDEKTTASMSRRAHLFRDMWRYMIMNDPCRYRSRRRYRVGCSRNVTSIRMEVCIVLKE